MVHLVSTPCHGRLCVPFPSDQPSLHPLIRLRSSFKDSGAFEGPIGEVRHIFGKKKAKEECARLTLEYLLGEKERRMSDSRKMMEGIAGGQGAAGVAFGQPLGESKAAEGEGLTKEKEVYWSDSDEDEGHGFEDAVEVLHIAN
jgi:hypothetical protein